MEAKKITYKEANAKLIKLYKTSFPKRERVKFKDLFRGRFQDFDFFTFYENNELIGLLHLYDGKDFVHLNYLAVNPKCRCKGYGSQIMSWAKDRFANKPIVLDVEMEDENSDNNEQRIRRIKFYKKNGFQTGKYGFSWEGMEMHYMYMGNLPHEQFMEYIQVIFPTIINVRPMEGQL